MSPAHQVPGPGTHLAWEADLALPESWVLLDLDEPEADEAGRAGEAGPDEARLAAELDRLLGLEPDLARHRDLLEASARSLHADCLARDAVAGAVRWAPDRFDGLATGVLMAFVAEQPSSGSDVLDDLERALAQVRPGDIAEPVVERVPHGPGSATRVQAIVETDAGPDRDGAPLLVETVQYWIPVPGSSHLLMLCFSTPNLAGAERLVAEFDAIARASSPVQVG